MCPFLVIHKQTLNKNSSKKNPHAMYIIIFHFCSNVRGVLLDNSPITIIVSSPTAMYISAMLYITTVWLSSP